MILVLLARVTVCFALPGGVDADVPLFTTNNKTVGIDVRDLPFSRCSIFKHSKGLAVLSGWSQRSQPTLHHKTVWMRGPQQIDICYSQCDCLHASQSTTDVDVLNVGVVCIHVCSLCSGLVFKDRLNRNRDRHESHDYNDCLGASPCFRMQVIDVCLVLGSPVSTRYHSGRYVWRGW